MTSRPEVTLFNRLGFCRRIEDATGLINAPSLSGGETKDAEVIVDAKKGSRRAKDRRRASSRKKLNREPPKPAVIVKPIGELKDRNGTP